MFPTKSNIMMDSDVPPSWIDRSPFMVYAVAGCSYASSTEMGDLAVSFQNLTFDVEAMGRELAASVFRQQSCDPDQIRQEFIRNGIDSAMSAKRARRAPPGFPAEPAGPLANLDNVQSATVAATLATISLDQRSSGETETSAIGSTCSGDQRVRRPLRRKQKENEDYCVFCYNNHEPEEVYLGHALHDDRGVQCPRLRQYVCPYCKATDRKAHTKKYCPSKPIITPEDLAAQGSVTARVLASVTASARGRQPSSSGGKRALRF